MCVYICCDGVSGEGKGKGGGRGRGESLEGPICLMWLNGGYDPFRMRPYSEWE